MPAQSWVQSGVSPVKWLFSHISALNGRLNEHASSHQSEHFQPLLTLHGISLTFWGLKATSSPPRSPLPVQLFYHSLSTCWPFLWSCYSGWSVGWSLCVCFECSNLCVIVWAGVCVCVCFSGKEREDWGESMQDAFASASREKGLFTAREPETISVISVADTVSHSGEEERKNSRGPKGEKKLLHRSFTVRFLQRISAPSKHGSLTHHNLQIWSISSG